MKNSIPSSSLPLLVALLLSGAFLFPTLSVQAGEKVASGTFSGRSDHTVTGVAELVRESSGYKLVLQSDFRLDSAPDPWVGFGKDGYRQESEIGKLKKKSGAQEYELPSGFDPSAYNEVVIWCKKFSVPLGVAKLQ